MAGKMARSRLEGRAPRERGGRGEGGGVVLVESATGYPSKPRSTNSLTITAPRAYTLPRVADPSGSLVSEIRSGERSRTCEIRMLLWIHIHDGT